MKRVTLKSVLWDWRVLSGSQKQIKAVGLEPWKLRRPSTCLLIVWVCARPSALPCPHGGVRADPEGKAGQLAQQAECYNAVAGCMKATTEQGAELSKSAACSQWPVRTWLWAAGLPGGSSWVLSRKLTPLTRSCSWLRTIRRKWSLNWDPPATPSWNCWISI